MFRLLVRETVTERDAAVTGAAARLVGLTGNRLSQHVLVVALQHGKKETPANVGYVMLVEEQIEAACDAEGEHAHERTTVEGPDLGRDTHAHRQPPLSIRPGAELLDEL